MNGSGPGPQTLAEWECADQLARVQQREFGLWPRDEIAGLSGLEIYQRVAAGSLPGPPLLQTLDIRIVEVAHGRIVLQGRPRPTFCNPMGSAHGGWIATLLDMAAGSAVQTTVPAGRSCTTSNLSIHYVRALLPDVGLVRAIGRVVHPGRTMGTSEAQVVGADGRLYAHATSTVPVISPR